MITKVVHGWRPAGLVAYLLGPGTAEVHRAPRVIASWDGLDAAWQPAFTGPGEYDLALGPLITALHAPVIAAGLPTRAPAEHGKRGYVWHCSARVAGSDRVLSDGEWAGSRGNCWTAPGSRRKGMWVGRGGWRRHRAGGRRPRSLTGWALFVLIVVTVTLRAVGAAGMHRLRGWPTALRGGLAAMFVVTGGSHFVGMREDLISMVPRRCRNRACWSPSPGCWNWPARSGCCGGGPRLGRRPG